MKVEKYMDMLFWLSESSSDMELARKLGVHHSTFSHLRSRGRNLSDGLILAIHEKLGVPVAEMRKWEDFNKQDIKGG